MEPAQLGELTNRPRPLILFTGLDLSNRPIHFNLVNEFRQRASELPPFNIRALVSGEELPHHQKRSNKGKGYLSREWLEKYRNEVPALVVLYLDLDWDHPSWREKLLEAKGKVESLRSFQEHYKSNLIVVLLQEKIATYPAEAQHRSDEFCLECRLTPKQLFVIRTGSELVTYVHKLGNVFHEMTPTFYQSRQKVVRARVIPHNSVPLLIRQHFKLGFLAEFRQDTHTALRYYKSAYDHCLSERFSAENRDQYELRNVASLLTYKIFDLNFAHNAPREAINFFNKHMVDFFHNDPGAIPTRSLAQVEYDWWRSAQAMNFANLFDRAVANGLTAVAGVNPGTFIEIAAHYYGSANRTISEIKINRPHVAYPQPDPLIAAKSEFFGQRAPALTGSVPDPQLVVRALELKANENYAAHIELLESAGTHFKKYDCTRLQQKLAIEIAEVYAASGRTKDTINQLAVVLKEGMLPAELQVVLLKKVLWYAYNDVAVPETFLAALQLARLEPLNDERTQYEAIAADILNGKAAINPYSADMAEERKNQLAHFWENAMSQLTATGLKVNCSKLTTLIEVAASFPNNKTKVDVETVPCCLKVTNYGNKVLNFKGFSIFCEIYEPSEKPIKGVKGKQYPFAIKKEEIVVPPNSTKKVDVRTAIKENELLGELWRENTRIKLSSVWLEARSESGIPVMLTWDDSCISESLDDFAADELQTLSITAPSGGIVNAGEKVVNCLLGEVYSKELIIRNDSNIICSNVRLEYIPGTQPSINSLPVLFADDQNHLGGELSVFITNTLNPGEQMSHKGFRFSPQLNGSMILNLKMTYITPKGQKKTEDFPITIIADEPFSVRSQILTPSGIGVTNVLNTSPHLLKVDLKTNATIQIKDVQWLMADIVDDSAPRLSTPEEHEAIFRKDMVVSYCTSLVTNVKNYEGDETPLGRIVVYWKRADKESEAYVRSVIPLCRTFIAKCPISIRAVVYSKTAEMKRPLDVTYFLCNNTNSPIDVSVSFDVANTFLLYGRLTENLTLLPNAPQRVNIAVMGLSAGRFSFPRIQLRSPTITDSVMVDCQRNIPSTIHIVYPDKRQPVRETSPKIAN
ncbi:unnamed protein product, partial [Mesorhabditis spiculigera]